MASPGLFSNRVTIDIDFGEEKSIWRDNRLKAYDGRLKKYNTVIDALNYMGMEGWIFMNAYPVSIGPSVVYNFSFIKEFPVSDVQAIMPQSSKSCLRFFLLCLSVFDSLPSFQALKASIPLHHQITNK